MKIEVKNLSYGYGEHKVIENISFIIQAGEFVSVMGANGVGKSTLFRCMLGIIRDYSGEIFFDGIEVRKITPKSMAKIVSYIPQSHYPAFSYSVFDMVLMGTNHQISLMSTPQKKQIEQAENAIEKIGISYLKDKSFHRISGGERQLTLLARALAQNAKIIIMDEPTANLDYGNQVRVLNSMRELSSDGYSIIQSTHNPEQAYLFSERILALYNGTLITDGIPKDVMTAEIMNSLYGISLEIESLREDSIRICVPSKLPKYLDK